MIKTIEDLVQEKSKIISKHGELVGGLEVKRVCDANIDLDIIANFVNTEWGKTYGNEPILSYSGTLFKLYKVNPECSFVCIDPIGRLVGSLISMDRTIICEDTSLKGGFHTALTVTDKFRGHGLSQILRNEHLISLSQKNYDFSVCWYDSRHNGLGSALNTYLNDKHLMLRDIPMYAKTFDLNIANRITTLKSSEIIVGKVINYIFPQKSHHELYQNQFNQGLFQSNDYSIADSTNAYISYLPKILKKREVANGSTRAFSLNANGVISAFVQGYFVNLNRDLRYFNMDTVFFSNELSYLSKKNFLSAVEFELRFNHNCFSVTAMKTASKENIMKFGYFPFMNQKIGVIPLTKKAEKINISTMLIDYK
jgi:hypothetical protein